MPKSKAAVVGVTVAALDEDVRRVVGLTVAAVEAVSIVAFAVLKILQHHFDSLT